MKKNNLFGLLLTVLIIFSLAACNNKEEDVSAESSSLIDQEESDSMELTEEPTEESATSSESTEPTEEFTEEFTEEPVTSTVSSGDKPDFGSLSDDLYSFQVEINGDVYQFPMTYEQFTSYGWELKGDDSESIDSNYYDGQTFNLGEMQCYAYIVNLDVSAHEIKDCLIGGIQIDSYISNRLEDPDSVSVAMPKDITFGQSSVDDITGAYGTPSRENTVDGGSVYITYTLDTYRTVELVVDGETNVLGKITIKNYVTPEGFEYSDVSNEVPEIADSYTGVSEVSDDFSQWTVDFGGKVYQLPVPLSELEADGWAVTENTETSVNGLGTTRVTLMKDNQQFRTTLKNYSGNATEISNCFVTYVESNNYDSQIPLIVSKGITVGTSEDELLTAIGSLDYEEDEGSTYRYYRIKPSGGVDHYDFYVDPETGLIKTIEVSYQPKVSEYAE